MFDSLLNIFQNPMGSGKYPVTTVKSTVDGQKYQVRDLPDKQEAADLLARIRLRCIKFADYLQANFPNKPQIQRLGKNYEVGSEHFFETTPDSDTPTYTLSKGESTHFCLRQRNDDQLVPEHVLMFVAIHEMGHVISKGIGHDAEFWNNMGWLLTQAERGGFYTPQNFQAHPTMYCGITITDAPRYDPAKDESAGTDLQIGTIGS